MIIMLWILGSIVSYLFIVGLLKAPFSKVEGRKCKQCYDGVHHWIINDDYRQERRTTEITEYHNDSLYAYFWPLALPFTLGTIITDSNRVKNKKDKAELRRNEEIIEAKHQAELAKIRADEDEYLTKQLQDK